MYYVNFLGLMMALDNLATRSNTPLGGNTGKERDMDKKITSKAHFVGIANNSTDKKILELPTRSALLTTFSDNSEVDNESNKALQLQ